MGKKIVTCLTLAALICMGICGVFFINCTSTKTADKQKNVIMNNVKAASKKIDDRQLVISSIKDIKFKTEETMHFGFLGNDSLITSEKFDTDTLVITNLLNGSSEKKTVTGVVQDCVNGRLLVSDKTYDYIYDLNTGKKTDLICKGSMSPPAFTDIEGKYILYDNDENYILFNIDSKKTYNLKAKFNPYFIGLGKMEISFSDDGKKVFYQDGGKILRSDLENIDNTTTLADLSDEADLIMSVIKIKGENGAVLSYLKDGRSKDGYLDFNTKQLKPIVNLPKDMHISEYNIIGNKSGSSTRIIYSEKANDNKMKICIGELKKGCLVKTTDIKTVDYDEIKETSWYSASNRDGSRTFLSIYDVYGIMGDYLINIK